MNLYGRLVICSLFALVHLNISAQILPKEYSLDSLFVTAKRITGLRKDLSGNYQWKLKELKALPKILGNADPLHYIQYFPGVQTSSEYDAGIHIQGCDNEHNEVSISGVPVYQPTHLLGLFSIFNPSHFSSLSLNTSSAATANNKLGGSINMDFIQEPVRQLSGEYAVGPMSSQGTLRLPVTPHFTVVTSARLSYLNLLYQPWLKFDETQLNYDFSDYNLTAIYSLGEKDKFWLNAYYGYDHAKLKEDPTVSSICLDWSNYVFSLHWQHLFRKAKLNQTAYITHYDNELGFRQNRNYENLPSDVQDVGYSASFYSTYIDVSAKAIWHHLHPQYNKRRAQMKGMKAETQDTQEYNLLVNGHYDLTHRWMVLGGVQSCYYLDDHHHPFFDILPQIGVQYAASDNLHFRLDYSRQKQYLFQTGFTDMGMPTEYWISCNENFDPQAAHSLSLTSDFSFLNGEWSISASLYYKQLEKQIEFMGSILDVVTEDYRLDDQLLVGKGKNYGFNFMLNKRAGRWKGWLSYSWNRAKRSFNHPDFPATYPANHERIHELKMLSTYRLNKRWDVGGTFVFASGTPFTAPEHFYYNNGNIITEFGPHNANRLKPYYRLDLSANYHFKKHEKYEHGLNVSVYNATIHKNALFYRVKFYKERFAYRPLKFMLFAMPSISYFCKF